MSGAEPTAAAPAPAAAAGDCTCWSTRWFHALTFAALATTLRKRHQRALVQDLRVSVASVIAKYRAHSLLNATLRHTRTQTRA